MFTDVFRLMASLKQLDSVAHERHGTVGVWKISNLNKLLDDEDTEETAVQHYRDVAGGDEITGSVVVIEEYDSLDADVQEHIAEAWSRLAEEAGVEKSAYVADGIGGMAIESNIETETVQTESFKSIDDAISWAS